MEGGDSDFVAPPSSPQLSDFTGDGSADGDNGDRVKFDEAVRLMDSVEETESVDAALALAIILEEAEETYRKKHSPTPLIDMRSLHLIGQLTEELSNRYNLLTSVLQWQSAATLALYRTIPSRGGVNPSSVPNWRQEADIERVLGEAQTRKLTIALRLMLAIVQASNRYMEMYLYDGDSNPEVDLLKLVALETPTEIRLHATGLLGFACLERRVADYSVRAHPEEGLDDHISAYLLKRMRYDMLPKLRQGAIAQPVYEGILPQTELLYVLRVLASVGEYQEVLAPTLEHASVEMALELLDSFVNDQRKPGPMRSKIQVEVIEWISHLVAHKKYAQKFVQSGGLGCIMTLIRDAQTALHPPRYLSASILWLLSGLAALSTEFGKIIQSYPDMVKELVLFAIEMLGCVQDIARKNASFFLVHALAFPAVVEIFDANQGADHLLKALADDVVPLKTMTLAVLHRNIVFCLRQYFRSHVALVVHHVFGNRSTIDDKTKFEKKYEVKRRAARRQSSGRAQSSGKAPMLARSPSVLVVKSRSRTRARSMSMDNSAAPLPHRAIAVDDKSFESYMNALEKSRVQVVEWMAGINWKPVDALFAFKDADENGVQLFLRKIESAEADISSHLIEVLRAVALLPAAYEHVCNAKVGGKLGISILLKCIKDEEKAEPELIRKSLEALVNLISTPKARKLARLNNALMLLLPLLKYAREPAEADKIRLLACRILLSLARDKRIAQVLSALKAVKWIAELTQGKPVLRSNAAVHRKLRHAASSLLHLVTLKFEKMPADPAGAIERSAAAAQTTVSFRSRELFSIMHDHLRQRGFAAAAAALRKDMDNAPMPLMVSHGEESDEEGEHRECSKPAAQFIPLTFPPSSFSPRVSRLRKIMIRSRKRRADGSTAPERKTCKKPKRFGASKKQGAKHTALEKMIFSHLRKMHSMCSEPVSVLPPFLLRKKHKCPTRTSSRAKMRPTQNSLAAQLLARQTKPSTGRGAAASVAHAHSRWTRTYKYDSGSGSHFTSVSYCGVGEFFGGCADGDLRRYSLWSTVQSVAYSLYNGRPITHVESIDESRVLTASADKMVATVWKLPIPENASSQHRLPRGRARSGSLGSLAGAAPVRISDLDDTAKLYEIENVSHGTLFGDRILANSSAKSCASLYDVARQSLIRTFDEELANNYERNEACFDSTGQFVMNDGILYDVRAADCVHKFDKFGESSISLFNTNTVVIDSMVWDLRFFKLLQSVPSLKNTKKYHPPGGRVIYSHFDAFMPKIVLNVPFQTPIHEKSFWTTDCKSYRTLGMHSTERNIQGLDISPDGLHCLVIANEYVDISRMGSVLNDSCVRLHEVGRKKARDDDSDIDDGFNSSDDDSDGMGDDDSANPFIVEAVSVDDDDITDYLSLSD